MDWEAENRQYQAQAPAQVMHHEPDDPLFGGKLGPYDPDDYNWSQEPPEDGICRDCYEWRRYPEGQRHFGLTWVRTCASECDHAHHQGEVWVGGGSPPSGGH